MNQETVDQINQALTMMNKAASNAGGFVLDQAPQVAKELVLYTLISNIFGVCLFLVVIMIFKTVVLPWYKRLWATCCTECEECTPGLIIGVIIVGIVMMIYTSVAVEYCDNAIKAGFAPRLTILDYAKELVTPEKK